MRVRTRIREGVARGLCGSCDNAHIIEDDLGRQTVKCGAGVQSFIVTRPLVHCTEYSARGTVSKYDMEKIAWTIDLDGNRFVGFSPPKKGSE